jgi:hypothetical protein
VRLDVAKIVYQNLYGLHKKISPDLFWSGLMVVLWTNYGAVVGFKSIGSTGIGWSGG